MENIECLACGKKVKSLPFGGYQHQNKIYPLYECLFCGLRFIFPQPTQEELGKTYNDLNYWQSGDFAGDKTDQDIYKKQYEKDAKKIKDLIKRYHILTDNFLEIGCARGDLLKGVQSCFKKVVGLDVSAPMIKLAKEKGLNVHLGKIENIELDDKFDCIYLGDLVEHLSDPVIFLKQLKGLAKESGVVIIEIPLSYNIYPVNLFLSPIVFLKNLLKGKILKPYYLNFFSSVQRRKNKKINHYPYHLTEFTPRSARKLINLAGWKIIYDHVYSGWPKRKYFRLKNFYLIALQLLFYFITKPKTFFDLGDRMTIVAKINK